MLFEKQFITKKFKINLSTQQIINNKMNTKKQKKSIS